MSQHERTTVVATYRVRPGALEEFLRLLREHHPLLTRLGLVTQAEPRIYVGEEEGGAPIVFEIFTWKDAASPDGAHASPEVMEMWSAMEKLVERRGGKPMWEFPHVDAIEIRRAAR